MKVIKQAYSRIYGVWHVMLRRAFKSRDTVANNKILISVCGNLGDFLLGVRAYAALAAHYTEQGRMVYFCGPSSVKTYMHYFPGLEDVVFIEFDGNRTDIFDKKKAFSAAGVTAFEKIVVFGADISWESLQMISCLQCDESWVVTHEREQHNIAAHLKRFFSDCFTNKLIVPLDMQQQQRNKLLLERLGVQGFNVRIYPIPKLEDYAFSETYITVAVDSSDSCRRWEADNFIDLIHRLESAFEHDIYITGSNVSKAEVLRYEEEFRGDDRVKITIGCLNIKQWIELIRGSWFNIGVDSGSAHVAASVGTKCFCLCGGWAGHRIMPYSIDKCTSNTLEPICIYRQDVILEDMSCYGCCELRGKFGKGNDECILACNSGKPCLCLEKITVDHVFDVVQKELCNA